MTDPPPADAVAPLHADVAPSGRRSLAGLALGAALLLPLVLTIFVSVRAERARKPELAILRPLAAAAAAAGGEMAARVRTTIVATGGFAAGALVAIGLFGLVRRKKEALGPALALFACALASLGQMQLLLGRLKPGLALYGAAIVLFGVALVRSRKETPSPPSAGISFRIAAAALVVIAWVGLFYRFYALGGFPPDFDGEASWFMACATSFYGAAQVNFGADGPWSPFGWLYYLPVLFFTRTCGTTLLSIRLVSAVTGFLAIPLFFGFLWRLAGRLEAILGTIFLCFGLTEIFWSRTDIFPYHAPGVLAVALAWTTFEAITTERLGWFVATAALMMLSYHQYPSGQTSFLIPIGAVLGRSLFSRGFVRRSWKGILVVLLGVALWAAGLGLNGVLAGRPFKWQSPFALNPGKTLWSLPLEHPGPGARAKFLAENAAKAAGVVVRSQFFELVPAPISHHEGVPTIEGLRRRHTSAPVAVLLALGVVALLLHPARPVSLVLLSWLVAGSLPGLLSDFPASRRIATLFPAFMVVAALAGGVVLRSAARLLGEKGGRVFAAAALGGTFAGLGAVAGFLYLGPQTSALRVVATADAMRPYLKTGTLAIFEADYGDYLATKLTYLLLDDLNTGPRPAAWRMARFEDWPTIALRPIASPGSWVYRYTLLRDRAAAFAKDPGFDRVTYLVQDTDERKGRLALLREVWAGREFVSLKVSETNQALNFVAVTLNAEALKDAQTPVVTLPAGADAAGGPTGWWEGVEVRLKRDGPPVGPITLSAGLWMPDQRWVSLRFVGAGEGARLLLDGVPHPSEESRPVTRGVHRLDLTLGSSPTLPLRLEQITGGGEPETVRPGSVTSPRLSALPSLAAETVLMYPGFDPPYPVARIEPGFLSDMSLAPDGSIVAVRSFSDRWKLEIHPSGGGSPRIWEQPRPDRGKTFRTSVACLGDKGVVLASWPDLYLFDRQGRLQKEIDLMPFMDGAEDVAANEEGEIFVVSSSRHGIIVLSPEGREIALLQPKDVTNWLPGTLSALYGGTVATCDSAARIRVFEKKPSGWEETRVQPGPYAVDGNRYAIRADGWLFSHDSNTREFLVFDRQLRRRVAADPVRDPARYEPGNTFLGFDRDGRLYTETNGRVMRFVPVTDLPDSTARK